MTFCIGSFVIYRCKDKETMEQNTGANLLEDQTAKHEIAQQDHNVIEWIYPTEPL